MRYRTQPYITTNNILSKLTPQQIAMAKAVGINLIKNVNKKKFFFKVFFLLKNLKMKSYLIIFCQ